MVGAALGWLLPYFARAVLHLFLRFQKDHLEGSWFGYHWTYVNSIPTLYKSEWRFKKGIFHRFSIRTFLGGKVKYIGYGHIERSQLVIKIHNRRNQETARFRFKWPISSNDNILPGIWLSFDHDIKIASGAFLLSRLSLSDVDAEESLKNLVRVERTTRPLMRLKD